MSGPTQQDGPQRGSCRDVGNLWADHRLASRDGVEAPTVPSPKEARPWEPPPLYRPDRPDTQARSQWARPGWHVTKPLVSATVQPWIGTAATMWR